MAPKNSKYISIDLNWSIVLYCFVNSFHFQAPIGIIRIQTSKFKETKIKV